MKTNTKPCDNGCVAHTLQAQLEVALHKLEVAQCDLNSKFLPSVEADRRRVNLAPVSEQRHDMGDVHAHLSVDTAWSGQHARLANPKVNDESDTH